MILWYIGLGLEKGSDYFTVARLILKSYTGLGKLKKLGLLSGLGLILLSVGLGLKKWINQEEMPLENYEDFLELFVKEFVIQLSPISLGQTMCGVWETKHYQ